MTRDDGYRATGRFQDRRGRTASLVVGAIVVAIGGAIVLSRVDPGRVATAPGPTGLDEAATTVPTEGVAQLKTAPLPKIAMFGTDRPTDYVPMNAGWLHWLDPRSGLFRGEVKPVDPAEATLTFVDAAGNVVQVCTTPTVIAGRPVVAVDMCAYRSDGSERARVPIVTLRPALLTATSIRVKVTPVSLDATVSRDGRWMWLAIAVHGDETWDVSIHRIDVAALALSGSREIRSIPVLDPGVDPPPAGQWWVQSASVHPVVRASPDGARLSLTIAALPLPGTPAGLLRQERLELDSTLDPTSPLDIAFPIGGAADLACDPFRSAWATGRHYLTLCQHLESNGEVQPFVRIENPADMTRDIAIGPAIPARDGTTDESSWLLDVRRGMLYRWSYLHRTFSLLDVASRAGATVSLDVGRPPEAPGWPVADPDDGLLSWTSLDGGTVPGWSGLRLAGSADGAVVYGISRDPTMRNGSVDDQPTIWAILARTGGVLGRWEAPGAVEQLALAPGALLVGLAAPMTVDQPGPSINWTTSLWFLDPRTGAPIEVVTGIGGPASGTPTLLPPVVARFAGS